MVADIVGAVEDVAAALILTGGAPLTEQQRLMIAGAIAFRLDRSRRAGATHVLERISREYVDDPHAETLLHKLQRHCDTLDAAQRLLGECRDTIARLLGRGNGSRRTDSALNATNG